MDYFENHERYNNFDNILDPLGTIDLAIMVLKIFIFSEFGRKIGETFCVFAK